MPNVISRLRDRVEDIIQSPARFENAIRTGRNVSLACLITSLALFTLGIVLCIKGALELGITLIPISLSLLYLSSNVRQVCLNIDRVGVLAVIQAIDGNLNPLENSLLEGTMCFGWSRKIAEHFLNRRRNQ